MNDHTKNPSQTIDRTLGYQLVLKSKTHNSLQLSYLVLRGPHGDTKILSRIYEHEFDSEHMESAYRDMPVIDSGACNKLLAAKTINIRIIMFLA